jgi:uncharacterized protein with PQ loop repeat
MVYFIFYAVVAFLVLGYIYLAILGKQTAHESRDDIEIYRYEPESSKILLAAIVLCIAVGTLVVFTARPTQREGLSLLMFVICFAALESWLVFAYLRARRFRIELHDGFIRVCGVVRNRDIPFVNIGVVKTAPGSGRQQQQLQVTDHFGKCIIRATSELQDFNNLVYQLECRTQRNR